MAQMLADGLSMLLLRPDTWTEAPSAAPHGASPARAAGDARIARALHWAQIPERVAADGGPEPARPWALDELLAMGRAGAAWGQVFKRLKAEGLIREQTLGQVVARWARRRMVSPPGGAPRAARSHAPM
jgi:hypothetical protein